MEKELYKWNWSGSCDPAIRKFHSDTFSVGIFQWIPKESGGLKKSKAVYRVKGWTGNPEEVYFKAEQICSALNEKFKRDCSTAYLILDVEQEIKKIRQSWERR